VAFHAPAVGRLEERADTGVFDTLLQAPDRGSGEYLPYGRHAVAPRIISVLIFSKTALPVPNLKRESADIGSDFGKGIRNARKLELCLFVC